VGPNQLDGRNQDLNPEIAADSILALTFYFVFRNAVIVVF